MLDQETKRKIDNARDILVGKVPDPKSQVEQITIALIYKFMDDMDKESEEMGGESTFFSGEFKKYAWSNIFDPRLGGFELIALYSDAIVKMNQNPNIPQLFRDIFKNAYLPYRDPETLKSFLKEINEFSYDHSERLGDAFEYLLSVMDSQGDAGQFRTPRHIIDFIIDIVDSKKNQTILDPACGTAGFLVSSYKHILKTNTKDRIGDKLTPDEKKRLLSNFIGYDISPDMVRLSLVNLYLHGFSDPKIVEYDTLTSEERWNETADIILANPPFMTPKGGIRPHKRFSIQARRSEVLFVDYIAEHLNPSGRAGVIVPEGIIFQSSNAYKNLRKMLVEDYLWAVVSLPAGIFQPYSGVKTSILLMDKVKAKQSDSILFLKVENDGFGLGAQRRPIDKNDLPEVLSIIQSGDADGSELAHYVKKSKIAESSDWNLSGERYVEYYNISTNSFPLIELNDLFLSIRNGKNVKQFDEQGKYRVTRIQTIADGKVNLSKTKWTNDEVKDEYFMEIGDILLSHINSENHLAKSAIFLNDEKVVHGINLIRFRPDKSMANPYYTALVFKSDLFIKKAQSFAQRAVNQASIKVTDLKKIQIPLPPLSVQEGIVMEIDGYQKIIDGARQVVDNYKPTIKIDPDWEMVELRAIASNKKYSIVDGPFGSSLKKRDYLPTGIPIIRIKNISAKGEFIPNDLLYISDEKYEELKRSDVQGNDVLISRVGTIGNVCLFPQDFGKALLSTTGVCKVTVNDELIFPKYLYYSFRNERVKSDLLRKCSQGVQKYFNLTALKSVKIPLPPLSVQQEIVAQIEAEQEMVNANKILIAIYEQKIKDRINEVWGE